MDSLDPSEEDRHELGAGAATGPSSGPSSGPPTGGGADLPGAAGAEAGAAYVVGERHVPTAPTTGDEAVDAAMLDLAAAEGGTLTQRIEAGERAHRVLQGRLGDLGGA
jgi:hypothetical protein